MITVGDPPTRAGRTAASAAAHPGYGVWESNLARGLTMTSTDFLLARIAEDEAAAQDEIERMKRWPAPGIGARYTLSLAHRFTPARVLAECEAKRRIVEMHDGAAQAVETISAADDGSPGADLALGVVKSVSSHS